MAVLLPLQQLALNATAAATAAKAETTFTLTGKFVAGQDVEIILDQDAWK